MTGPTSGSLRIALDVPSEARVGSLVPITLRAENVGDRSIELYLRGRTIAFDIVVKRADGRVVWRRLENAVIPAILRLEVLAPGQVLELRADWRPAAGGAAPAPPGTYTVEGLLLTDGPELRTDPVPIRITG